ncbi:MAG: hypothetical protein AAB319_00540, partial [Pseudomonadota bacterium]
VDDGPAPARRRDHHGLGERAGEGAGPAILLADEPTAHLDPATARDVAEIFRDFHRVGVTLLIATYDDALFAPFATQRLMLDHGRLAA